MQTVAGLAVLVLLSVSCGNAQEESFLGLPVEYDIFGFAEDVEAPIKETNTNADLLKRLCDEYDLQLYDKTIDCQSIKIVPRSLQIARHTVEKRQAEETNVEGSGEPDVSPLSGTDEDTVQEPQEPPSESDTVKESIDETDNADASVPADKEAEEPPAPSEGEEPIAPADKETEELPAPSEGEQPVAFANNVVPEEAPAPSEGEQPAANEESAQEDPIGDNFEPVIPYGEGDGDQAATNEGTTNEEVPNEESPSESQPDQPNGDANVEQAVPYEESASEAPSNVEENADSQDHVHEETTVLSVAVNEETTVANVKKGRKLAFGNAAAAPPQNTDAAKESGTENTETEKLHEHQSGNAILDTPGSDTIEGSEVAVRNMSPNENIKQSESDLPKSGESSETGPQQGRKDTKVLVILLVAVVIIGGAAFAYNFIKKRKQKKSDSSRSENGNAAQQRTDKDPERGTELKPLMNNSNLKVVEYKDEKGNGNTN